MMNFDLMTQTECFIKLIKIKFDCRAIRCPFLIVAVREFDFRACSAGRRRANCRLMPRFSKSRILIHAALMSSKTSFFFFPRSDKANEAIIIPWWWEQKYKEEAANNNNNNNTKIESVFFLDLLMREIPFFMTTRKKKHAKENPFSSFRA